MSKEEHRPGPWSVNTLPQWHTEVFAGSYLICEANGGQRFIVGQTERNFEQDEANARLIAAAPDMLFELEGIVAFADGFGCYSSDGPIGKELRKWIEGARAAITKAKGDAAVMPKQRGNET